MMLVLLFAVVVIASTGASAHSPSVSGCKFKGTTYKKGDAWVNLSICGTCKCNGGGQISCAPLCNPSLIKCLDGFEVKMIMKDIVPGKCPCPRPQCFPSSGCKFEGVALKKGDKAISLSTCGTCTCRGGGQMACIPLCIPSYIKSTIACRKGHKVKMVTTYFVPGKCPCKKPKCVKG